MYSFSCPLSIYLYCLISCILVLFSFQTLPPLHWFSKSSTKTILLTSLLNALYRGLFFKVHSDLQVNYMFMRFSPPLLQLIRNNPTMTMPRFKKTMQLSQNDHHCLLSSDKNIIRGFLNIFDCHLSIFDETWSKVLKLSLHRDHPNFHPRVNLSMSCVRCSRGSSSTLAYGTIFP